MRAPWGQPELGARCAWSGAAGRSPRPVGDAPAGAPVAATDQAFRNHFPANPTRSPTVESGTFLDRPRESVPRPARPEGAPRHHPRPRPRRMRTAFHSGVTRRASRRANATKPWRDARAPRMRPVPRDKKIPRRWAHPRRRRGVAEGRDVGTTSRRDGTDRVERSAARESRIATAARMLARVELECAARGRTRLNRAGKPRVHEFDFITCWHYAN